MRESKKFLSDLWRLARPYWTSEDRMAGIGLICIIVGMSLGLVYLNVLLNQWNNAFYDTLQNRDWQGFTHQLARFCLLAALFIAVAVYQVYLRLLLQIRWRSWLTMLLSMPPGTWNWRTFTSTSQPLQPPALTTRTLRLRPNSRSASPWRASASA